MSRGHTDGIGTGVQACALWISELGSCYSSRRRHTRCYRDWSSDVCCASLSRRRHTRCYRDWSSDVCSSDLEHTSELQSRSSRMPSSGVQTCALDRKSTRLNYSHGSISYAVFCFRKITKLNYSHGSNSYNALCLYKTNRLTDL